MSDTLLVPETKLKRVLIIGGGFGGIDLARRLHKNRYQVVMIDKNNYHTFQPLLYQVATGGLEPDSIAYPIRKIFSSHRNFIFRVGEATEVKSHEHILNTTLGDIKYDYLVLATGSATNFFGNKEIAGSAMPLKSVPDALDLRSLILQNFEKLLTENDVGQRAKYLNVVIVGGGPTGVEIAGALAELRQHVLPHDYPELNLNDIQLHVVEASDKLLSSMSEKSSVKSKAFLVKMGVKLWLTTSVVSYHDEKAFLSDGTIIPCNTFIWTAGVKGNPVMGFGENIYTKAQRLKVDIYNRVTGYNDVFAIGDVAAMMTPSGKEGHPMLAPVAMQQARNLAMNLNQTDNKGWKEFKYRDKGTMATIGRNKAVVDLKYIKFQGILAWLVWMFVHLMSIVGFRNRLVVLINWMWNYFSYDRAIRLIIRPYTKRDINA